MKVFEMNRYFKIKKFLSALLIYIFLLTVPVFAETNSLPAMQYQWSKQNLNVYIENSEYKNTAKKAFKDWGKSNFNFVFVDEPTNSDISIYIINKEFDKAQKIAANCEIFRNNNIIIHADIYVPKDKNKKIFEMVTAHEIGHALGIVQHSDENLMSKNVITNASKVTKDDINKLKEPSKSIIENKRDLSSYADACKQAKNYEQAIKIYQEILEQSPNFAPAIYSIGFCYYNMGNTEKANDFIKQAYTIEPDNPYFLNGYVKILLIQGEVGSAENVFDNFIKNNPTLKNHFAVKQSEKILKR